VIHLKSFFITFLVSIIVLIPACKSVKEATPEPEVKPDEEITGRLMTDAELVNREDPNAASVNQEWVNWIKDNVIPLRSLTHTDFSDLQFLKALLAGRSIVQLGESGHGVREFNKIKVRLIKFLHQEMDFNVIAFESCIFNCFYANKYHNSNGVNLIRHSIYSVWETQEVLELFNYISEKQDSANPLILAGFDMKPSDYSTTKKRPEFLRTIINTIDSAYADEVYDYDTNIVENVTLPDEDARAAFYIANEAEMKNFYGKLLTFFDENMTALLNNFPQDHLSVLVARRTLWSFIRNIDFQIALNQQKNYEYTLYRDSAMAENLAFLAEDIYPGKKIIVWAHNFHIRHRQEDINGLMTMGKWVAERFRSNLYTVGLYMYRGKAAWNNRTEYTITAALANSLEAIGYQARLKFFFLDMLNQIQVPGNSWMFTETNSKSWGSTDQKSVIRDQYDAIIFIDTVNAPDYL
jgi:erythromycin esterase